MNFLFKLFHLSLFLCVCVCVSLLFLKLTFSHLMNSYFSIKILESPFITSSKGKGKMNVQRKELCNCLVLILVLFVILHMHTATTTRPFLTRWDRLHGSIDTIKSCDLFGPKIDYSPLNHPLSFGL